MSMKYIRDLYGVPAKRGGRVAYEGNGVEFLGTITGTDGMGRLRVRLDGHKDSMIFHPTWRLRYLEVEDAK